CRRWSSRVRSTAGRRLGHCPSIGRAARASIPRCGYSGTVGGPALARRPRYARPVRLSLPLAAEVAAARAIAALSRLAGTGGGTTVPGKLLTTLHPGALDRLAARLPAGAAVVSATNGKTTTAAMAAEILRPRFRLAHNAAGANLVSGVASALLAAPG